MKKILIFFLLFNFYNLNAQVPNYVSTDSLIAWWEFSGNANDQSGNNLDGQTYSAVLTQDRFGNLNSSYDFNGFDAYIEIPSNNFLIGPTTSLTVSAWFLANTLLGTRAIFTHRDTMPINSSNLYGIWLQDNNYLYSEVNGDSTSIPLYLGDSVQVGSSNWHHFVLVVNEQEINHYLNGIKVSTLYAQAGNIDLRNKLARIGRHRDLSSNTQYFNGKIDDIGIWSRSLDSCEILDLFNASPGNCCTQNLITSQPTNQTVNMGSDAIFSFDDTLIGANYQWQMDAGTGYNNLSNAGQFSGTDSKILTISSTSMSNNNTLYRCVITESASCLDTTDVATLTVTEPGTSINELNSALIKVYPNPSESIINLELNDNSAGKVVLIDMLGKEVLSKSFTSKDVQINLKSLASKGTYFAKVIDLDGNVIAIKKLIYQ